MESEPSKSSTQDLSHPPHHAGEAMPSGQEYNVVEPVVDPAFTNRVDGFDRSKGKGKGRMLVPADVEHREPWGASEDSSAASNRSESFRPDSMVTDYTYPTAGTDASTIASSSRRSSGGVTIPHSRGKPITAGGVPLGLRAMHDRNRRLSSMPIYEQPEQDFDSKQPASLSALPKLQEDSEPNSRGPPSSTLRGSKRYDSVGVGDHGKKQPVTETKMQRHSSVMQKARMFGRKVRYSMSG